MPGAALVIAAIAILGAVRILHARRSWPGAILKSLPLILAAMGGVLVLVMAPSS